jgi:hypothetical protein
MRWRRVAPQTVRVVAKVLAVDDDDDGDDGSSRTIYD